MNPLAYKQTPEQEQEQNEFLKLLIQRFPDELPTKLISEHAQEKRILPPGTPRPGPLDLSYTPYLVEPMNNMSPMIPIQRTVILKGAQLGFTTLAECVLGYYMGYSPQDILFMSATDGILERWATRRLEPAIDSYGLRENIKSNDATQGRKRVGDKMFSKEYFGMRLDMASAQSAASMRATDKRILIRDEIDGAPAQLKTGEGNWLSVSYARTNAWASRRKVLDFGTPTTFQDSLIYPEYEKGDQRKFLVPCPHCNESIELKFEQLTPETEAGKLVDVLYGCQSCGVILFNHDKITMLDKGYYKPTKEALDPNMRSYHISSMYAPIGMITWLDIYRLYQLALNEVGGMRSFTNLYLGLPYQETGSKPKIEKVIELKGGYKSGEIPEGVLFLTLGADVQQGSKTDKKNPPRIELEVLGTGHGWRNFSIEYLRFEGAIDDAHEGAWKKLNDWAETCKVCHNKCNFRSPGCEKFLSGMSYKNNKDIVFNIETVFIDSGDGNYSHVIYRFCERWNNTTAIKGSPDLKKKKGHRGESIDAIVSGNRERYRFTKSKSGDTLCMINTNYYKSLIYHNLKIPKVEIGESKPGSMSFPRDYKEKYFKMLTAEVKLEDGTFYCPAHTRNESLDTKVYSLAAADVYLENLVLDFKAQVKENGGSKVEVDQVNTRFVIEYLKKNLLTNN